MASNTSEATVEQRLTTVERTVEEILHRLEMREPAPDWLQRFRGCMADEPAFAEVIRYGREFRRADRPTDDDDEAST